MVQHRVNFTSTSTSISRTRKYQWLHLDVVRPLLYRDLILYVEKADGVSKARAATLDLLGSTVSGERVPLVVQQLDLVTLTGAA